MTFREIRGRFWLCKKNRCNGVKLLFLKKKRSYLSGLIRNIGLAVDVFERLKDLCSSQISVHRLNFLKSFFQGSLTVLHALTANKRHRHSRSVKRMHTVTSLMDDSATFLNGVTGVTYGKMCSKVDPKL